MVVCSPTLYLCSLSGLRTTPLRLPSLPQIFVRDSTAVNPYALLLFGGDVGVQHIAGTLTVGRGNFVGFKAVARIGVLVKRLRLALDSLLIRKITEPDTDISGRCVCRVA